MLIHQKVGNMKDIPVGDRAIDILQLHWHETDKRILHKKTNAGRQIILKFLNQGPDLRQDDVIFENEDCVIAIDIQPCEAIVMRPESMYQMACLCYEIGNRHLPLFFQENELLVPYEAPLFHLLAAAGFQPITERKKLLNQLKTNVSPHSHLRQGESLFSKILKLTTTTSA